MKGQKMNGQRQVEAKKKQNKPSIYFQNELGDNFPSANLKEMLDAVGIRLPTYKVRELTLSLKNNGELEEGDLMSKMKFIQVMRVDSIFEGLNNCS